MTSFMFLLEMDHQWDNWSRREEYFSLENIFNHWAERPTFAISTKWTFQWRKGPWLFCISVYQGEVMQETSFLGALSKLLSGFCPLRGGVYPPFLLSFFEHNYPARALRARARRAHALRALGLLLADGTPTVGGGKTFWVVSRIFLRKQL